jgi:TP901 family phage tail tape measure protein
MLRVIIEVDTELTSLKKVMSEETNFDQVLLDANEAARQFGRTITGALQAYNSFAKMGFDQQQVKELGDAAMLLSTVGEIEDKDSAEFLTSTVLQFNMAVEDSTKIVDSWNEVSNNYAVTSKDLALAITRSGQSAEIAKVSFDELNGMVTAIQASTRRGGAQIGNSLKTIFTRLRMDGVKDALGEIGIAVYDTAGDFRSATDVFNDLSKQWSSLSNVQRSFISEQIAG